MFIQTHPSRLSLTIQKLLERFVMAPQVLCGRRRLHTTLGQGLCVDVCHLVVTTIGDFADRRLLFLGFLCRAHNCVDL